MRKFVILLFFILYNFVCVFAQTNNAVINPDYKKEEFSWCPSAERAEHYREKYINKYGCIGASINLYSERQREIALDFAKKIKYIYKTQDINALADIAPYPNVFLYNYKNKKFVKIKSKEELLKLDKNVLLNRNTSNKINESFLNWSWEGFNFSHCGLLFFVENNVTMLAISLK